MIHLKRENSHNKFFLLKKTFVTLKMGPDHQHCYECVELNREKHLNKEKHHSINTAAKLRLPFLHAELLVSILLTQVRVDALINAHWVQNKTYGQEGVHLVIVLGDLPHSSSKQHETTVNICESQDRFGIAAFSRQHINTFRPQPSTSA